jgi:hypothetical protein
MREYVETVRYIHPITGEEYDPAEPPVIYDPEGDEDSELGADDDV